MKYFKSTLVNDIKAEYRQLAKQYHPDIGGSDAIMKEINRQYFELLKRANGQEVKGDDDKVRTYKFDPEAEQAIIDKLRSIHNLRLPSDIDVYIIGTWIWVLGNTKAHKESLKFLEFKWHTQKLCWYWHKPDGYRKRSGKSANFHNMAMMYGCQKFDGFSDNKRKIAA